MKTLHRNIFCQKITNPETWNELIELIGFEC